MVTFVDYLFMYIEFGVISNLGYQCGWPISMMFSQAFALVFFFLRITGCICM